MILQKNTQCLNGNIARRQLIYEVRRQDIQSWLSDISCVTSN